LKYFLHQAILEIEELRIKNPKFESQELQTLEVSCRMNYATVKAKKEEWDISMEQAQKVITPLRGFSGLIMQWVRF